MISFTTHGEHTYPVILRPGSTKAHTHRAQTAWGLSWTNVWPLPNRGLFLPAPPPPHTHKPIASHFLAALCFQVENYFRSFMMRKLYENHGEFALQGMPASRVHQPLGSVLRIPCFEFWEFWVSTAGIRIPYICICSTAICGPDQGASHAHWPQRPSHNETSFCFCFSFRLWRRRWQLVVPLIRGSSLPKLQHTENYLNQVWL